MNRKQVIGIITIYAGLAILASWPLATHLSTHLPSNSNDSLVHFWNAWWVQQALQDGHFPYFTSNLFYPTGISLVTHNLAWFHIVPWLVLEPLLGGLVAYNVTLLLTLTFCGCACFALSYKLIGDVRFAFLAGLIYQVWPYRISQLDHPNLIATAWIPLFMLALILTLEKGKWRYAVMTGICFALVGFTRWQLLVPATLAGLVYVLLGWQWWWPEERRFVIGRLLFAAGVAAVLLYPPFSLLLQQDIETADLLREGEEEFMQTDVLAYFTPTGSHTFLHEFTQPLYNHYYPDRAPHRRVPAYIGFTTLGLLFLGMWQQRGRGLPWLLLAILFAWLALGPLLRVNGQFYNSSLMLYDKLPLVNLMRTPDRFNMFIALPVAILAGYGANGLWKKGSWLVVGLLSIIILAEYTASPVPVRAFPVSPFFTQLADEPGDFAILNLPFDTLRAKMYMFAQTKHGRPILQGKIARLPEEVYHYLNDNPLLNSLRHTQEVNPQLTDVSQQLAMLAEDGIRYIVIHKRLVGADRVMHWQRYLLTQPYYEDESIVVYSTEPKVEADFNVTAELVPGLGPVRTFVSSDCVNPGRVLAVDVGWGQTQASKRELTVGLSLLDERGESQQAVSFPLTMESHLMWGYYSMRLDEDLPVGDYMLMMHVPEGERPLPLQAITVQPTLCAFDTEPEAVTANALFGDELQLLAYDIDCHENHVVFTLHWRAQQHMFTDYKIFVHVFDPATGVPVTQDDSRPRREAYPTIYWSPGEILADRVPVSLQGVSPGNYGVAIGIYDPLTGERLFVVRDDGVAVDDGRYILEDLIEVR